MPKRQNILFITADQLRKDAIGCCGNLVIQTPVLDGLAKRGVRFERMFAAYPVCAPNRASMITGRYPTIHRVKNNGVYLPEGELTLMEILRRAGYHTYGAGKMHFGPQWKFTPDGSPLVDPSPELAINPQPEAGAYPWYGFERVMLTEDHRMGPYGDTLKQHGYNVWDELHSASFPQSATQPSPFPEELHQTTWITDRALEMLAENPKEDPFFLWVSYVHPHHPFNPPAPYDSMYDPQDMPLPVWHPGEVELWPEAYRQKYFADGNGHEAVGLNRFTDKDWQRIKAFYYGMISLIDKNIGRILDALRKNGQLENTLVVFTADHGENLGDHHLLFKGTTYDCVTNVPFIIATSDGRAAGQQRDLLCSTIDLMPTILELAGIPCPEPCPIQGNSLVPAVEDDTLQIRDALLIENGGLRRSVRTQDALLTWHGTGLRGELYDLKNDPDCLHNLWDVPGAAGLQKELLDRLIGLMAENVDPLPARLGVW